MRVAKRHIPSVMVEMPVIPGSEQHMHKLFRAFQEVGIDGINLLEFCFPFCNWDEFSKRGFMLKNPPFEVMYDYDYSGGLAVAGSEALCPFAYGVGATREYRLECTTAPLKTSTAASFDRKTNELPTLIRA